MIIDPATNSLLRTLYTISDDCDMPWTYIPSAQDAAPAGMYIHPSVKVHRKAKADPNPVCQVHVTGRAFPSLYHS